MDAVRTELMRNRFSAIVEEASTIAYRSAHTTFVKQTQDYQCAMATREGELFAYPRQSGVTSFIGVSLKATIDTIGVENFCDGDIIITNDPFSTEGLCSHPPDIHLLKPIFIEGEIVAFGWAFIHASDIGGAVPGSISAASTEVFQEGIRIRSLRLYRGGELNQELVGLFQDNCRIPSEVWGDLQAMVAALRSMDKRLKELCSKLAVREVLLGMEEVLNLAELRARAVIKEIPDGIYCFNDYVEGLKPNEMTFVHVTMTISDDGIELDFNGSDPQVPAAINFVSGSRTHPFLTQVLNFFIITRDPTTPLNGGLVRPIRTRAPSGSVMNAEFPAASGNRWITAVRIYDTVLGCIDKALGKGIAAAGPGQSAVVAMTARDPITGRKRVNVINPFCGGGGGRLGADGVDGVDGPQASLKNTPVEVIEVETMVRVRQYQLKPDTFGAGQRRSGAALVMELENLDIEAVMAVRGLNRNHFAPWGYSGGHPGALGEITFNPGRVDERRIQRFNILELRRGDVVRMVTPAGGGFGDPLQRNPESVLADVESGLLSAEKALHDYGVVCTSSGVDAIKTERKRAGMRSQARQLEKFSFCEERISYERIWSRDVRAYLATKVFEVDPPLRHHILSQVRDRLIEHGRPADRRDVEESVSKELQALHHGQSGRGQ